MRSTLKSLFGIPVTKTFREGVFGKETAAFDGVSTEKTTSPKTSKV